MPFLQAAQFFPGIHQNVSIVFIIGAAANRPLADEQLKAVITGGAVIDFLLPRAAY
jgi:hypothetical protein